jgi:hypothetical protein
VIVIKVIVSNDESAAQHPEMNFHFDVLRLIQVDGFDVASENGLSTIIQKTSDKFIYLHEKDRNGRLNLKTLILSGQVVHHQTFTYTFDNQLQEHSTKMQNNSNSNLQKVYLYTPDGYLKSVTQKDLYLKYDYNVNGNIVAAYFGVVESADESLVKTNIKVDFGERAALVGSLKINYDEAGKMISKQNFTFKYHPDGSFKSVQKDNVGILSEFIYSSISGQVIAQFKTNDTVEYFYGLGNSLITHIHSTQSVESP